MMHTSRVTEGKGWVSGGGQTGRRDGRRAGDGANEMATVYKKIVSLQRYWSGTDWYGSGNEIAKLNASIFSQNKN